MIFVFRLRELLSFSTRWIWVLIHRYNEGGPEALGDRRAGNGASPKILTPAALAALKERIRTQPDDGGLSSQLTKSWISDSVALLSLRANQRWRWDDRALFRMT